IPQELLSRINVHPVDSLGDVFRLAFSAPPPARLASAGGGRKKTASGAGPAKKSPAVRKKQPEKDSSRPRASCAWASPLEEETGA
ncbi:MAG: hypothetical protein LBJ82_01055, partial [Deltaproteobacteria bacterium]|nr:hypothetical protein [Deltaproteobacteria bacterium]